MPLSDVESIHTKGAAIHTRPAISRRFSTGPPSVMVYGSAKSWRYPIRVMIPTKNVVGAKSGKVTYLN